MLLQQVLVFEDLDEYDIAVYRRYCVLVVLVICICILFYAASQVDIIINDVLACSCTLGKVGEVLGTG